MKRVYFLTFLLLFLVGCASLNPFNWLLPSDKNKKAQDKIAAVEKKLEATESAEISKAKGYIYGSQKTLSSDPDPNKYTLLAYDLNSKALLTLGPPSMEDAKKFDEIVIGLLSTNENIKASARKLLDAKDLEVIKLQNKEKQLEEQLEVKEGKLKELATVNAGLADKWTKVTRFIKWGFYALIIGFIASVVLNNLPPPWNLLSTPINIIFGAFGKMVYGLFPKVREFSGSVAKETYSTTESTLKSLVAAIQEIKSHDSGVFKEKLEPILKDKTSITEREKILEIKKNLGHI